MDRALMMWGKAALEKNMWINILKWLLVNKNESGNLQ
jgi:hypothetical protein